MPASVTLVGSVAEAAVSKTEGLAGTVEGAWYVVGEPLAVVEGETLPHPDVHVAALCVTAQFTCEGVAGSF